MLVLQSVLMLPKAVPVPPPQQTALQHMLQLIEHMEPSIGPGHWNLDPAFVPWVGGMWDRWKLSKMALHPLHGWWTKLRCWRKSQHNPRLPGGSRCPSMWRGL